MFRGSKKTPGTDGLPTEFYNKKRLARHFDQPRNYIYIELREVVLAKDRGKIKDIIVV